MTCRWGWDKQGPTLTSSHNLHTSGFNDISYIFIILSKGGSKQTLHQKCNPHHQTLTTKTLWLHPNFDLVTFNRWTKYEHKISDSILGCQIYIYSSSFLLNTTSILYYTSYIYKLIVNLLIFINFNFFLLYFINVLF